MTRCFLEMGNSSAGGMGRILVTPFSSGVEESFMMGSAGGEETRV